VPLAFGALPRQRLAWPQAAVAPSRKAASRHRQGQLRRAAAGGDIQPQAANFSGFPLAPLPAFHARVGVEPERIAAESPLPCLLHWGSTLPGGRTRSTAPTSYPAAGAARAGMPFDRVAAQS
jgi:hypothetical protein